MDAREKIWSCFERAEKTFSVSMQTEITSGEASISLPHRLRFSKANDVLVSASDREQTSALMHVWHWMTFFTIRTTYPAM